MTKAQVNALLSLLNTEFPSESGTKYVTDAWIDCEEISEIIISTDENIYPDSNLQVYFDSENELLKTRLGKKKATVFKPKHEPALVTSYDDIVGIALVGRSNSKSPFRRGTTV